MNKHIQILTCNIGISLISCHKDKPSLIDILLKSINEVINKYLNQYTGTNNAFAIYPTSYQARFDTKQFYTEDYARIDIYAQPSQKMLDPLSTPNFRVPQAPSDGISPAK